MVEIELAPEEEINDDDSEDVEKECYFRIENHKSECQKQLQQLVKCWTQDKPDLCLLSSDNQRVFTHKRLFSLHSKFLCSLLSDGQQYSSDLSVLSTPCSGASLRCLLRLLNTGVTVSDQREHLKEAGKAAKLLGIMVNCSRIKSLQIPKTDVLSYSKPQVQIKVANVKPNIIDVNNPCLDDLDILDDEIEILETVANPEVIQEFPDRKKFRTKVFTERVKSLKDSGAVIQKLIQVQEYDELPPEQLLVPKFEPMDEFAPGRMSSSQSDTSSVILMEKKTPKRKLYAEDSELREIFEEDGFQNKSARVNRVEGVSLCSVGTSGCSRSPKTNLQKELYNNCDECIKRRAEDNIKMIKQKKYFQMLKEKRAEAEKFKGQKFPCDKCDYVAALPSNLKTHQLANHDGVDFVDKYVNEYFEKNKFLIL